MFLSYMDREISLVSNSMTMYATKILPLVRHTGLLKLRWCMQVSVGDFIVRQQSIGNATSSFGFDGFDGILGLGPDDLTNGTVSGLGLIPTFTQNLKSQGVISKNVLGVYFHPELGNVGHLSFSLFQSHQLTYEKDTADVNGLLTFGGVDTDKCPGTITYTPRTQVLPFAMWWGVDVQATSYGSTVLSGEYSTLVDTVGHELRSPAHI
jgi:hypothetical protein